MEKISAVTAAGAERKERPPFRWAPIFDLRPPRANWRGLLYFSLYRNAIAFLFLGMILADWLPSPGGLPHRGLFPATVVGYLLCSLPGALLAQLRWPSYMAQLTLGALADIVALSLMMYASGGVGNGFGLLLLVSVAGNSILAGNPAVFLYASLAAMAVLYQELYAYLVYSPSLADFPQTGLFCLAFYAAAGTGAFGARRVATSEAQAERERRKAEDLAQLNERILRMLQTGVLVLDDGLRVQFGNRSAMRLLGDAAREPRGRALSELSEDMAMLARKCERRTPFRARLGELEVQGIPLQEDGQAPPGWLIVLEDSAAVQQRATALKNASLARLTASISHEIRNPLGAISHAGQLLAESAALSAEERRLVRIIARNGQRMNGIVENVMTLGRRAAQREELHMDRWLPAFAREFAETKSLRPGDVATRIGRRAGPVSADAGQLHQVLWNLGENALRYSRRQPLLKLVCGTEADSRAPYIDVIDSGRGIREEYRERLFEPFFTTEAAGSGLGLYVASQLCEANRAALALHANSPAGCRFRVRFEPPDSAIAV